MSQENYLPNLIGQQTVKNRLNIYRGSYAKEGRLPFILFNGPRGAGKTKFIREFRSTLVRPDGSMPPMIEVNGAAIKKADQFFEQIYPKVDNERAVLFIDECHELPDKLTQLLLTICEKDKNPVRRITYETKDLGPVDYIFDFRRISFVFATTDAQKLPDPLVDRFTEISIGHYTKEELYQIFELNLVVNVEQNIKEEIISVLRGHPRSSVELAEELDHYADAHGLTCIDRHHWREFRDIMGVYPYGLNNSEVALIKVLGERGACSLNSICATTGFSKSVVMNKHEHALLNKGLIEVIVQSKRCLTGKGRTLYTELFDEEPPVKNKLSLSESPVRKVKNVVDRINTGNHPLYQK